MRQLSRFCHRPRADSGQNCASVHACSSNQSENKDIVHVPPSNWYSSTKSMISCQLHDASSICVQLQEVGCKSPLRICQPIRLSSESISSPSNPFRVVLLLWKISRPRSVEGAFERKSKTGKLTCEWRAPIGFEGVQWAS